jgi:hypothetical protein
MKLFLVLTIAALGTQFGLAFAPYSLAKQSSGTAGTTTRLSATAEVEELLRKAAKLKAEAAAAEQELHKVQLEKKQCKDSDMDDCIDRLFPLDDNSVSGLAKRLKESHWSTDKLMKVTRRLHEREICAQGKSTVTASNQKVATTNPKELARVQGLIDRLIEAADVIDEEYMAEKRKSKEQKYLSHVDLDHWTMGDLAGHLRRQVGELRREHEEQFQERLESFYEAQRKNKHHTDKK